MTTNTPFEEARRLFSEAQSSDEFRAVLREVERVETDDRADYDLESVRAEAIKALLRFSSTSPAEEWEVVEKEVLPLCLRTSWPPKRGGWMYTEVLKAWLEGLTGAARADYRSRIVTAATGVMGGKGTQAACNILAAVGYRDHRAVAALDAVIANSDEKSSDTALRTRVALGVAPEDHERLEHELRARIISGRWNQPLVGTAHVLATATLLPVMAESWLLPAFLAARVEEDLFLLHLTLLILPTIAEKTSEDGPLQDRIWQHLLSLRPHLPKEFDQLLNMNGKFGQLCDTPMVASTYLEALGAEHPIVRHRATLRLAECVRPRQLAGWADPPPGIAQRLEADASAPSGITGRWSTLGLDTKRDGCQTLLSLGCWDAFERSIQALSEEKNGYAMADVLDIAACFPLAHLPKLVPDFIAARFEELPDDKNQRLAAQVSAIKVAHSAVSSEALAALLGYERYGVSGVLISLTDAMADCAVGLALAGDQSAVDTLLSTARSQAASPDGRSAAAAALARIASRLPEAVSPVDLFSLVRDRVLDDFARRSLLDSLGYLTKRPDSEMLASPLRAIADGADDLGPNVREHLGSWNGIALRALARQGRLADESELLIRHLGLVQSGASWDVGELGRAESGGFTIGLLYAQRPMAFAPAIATLLTRSGWPLVAQLLPLILRVPQAPGSVASALAERAARALEGRTAEPDLYRILAAVAPRQLAIGPWVGLTEWAPSARVALADALRNTGSLDPEAHRRRQETLTELIGNGQYPVRRAAYRAMAVIAPPSLIGLSSSWASSEDEELRRRAAEAVCWLEEDLDIRQQLKEDRARSVREAYARCEIERRERRWAALYASQVLGVISGEQVLPSWRLGRALERLGDDDTLELLERRKRDEAIPPSVRHWLDRLAKAVRGRWEDVTRNWPDPCFIRRGALEFVKGTLRAPDEVPVEFEGWLWTEPAETPTGFGSWGGWAEQLAVKSPDKMEHLLEIHGRKSARVLISHFSLPSGPVSFLGNGRYPEADIGADSG